MSFRPISDMSDRRISLSTASTVLVWPRSMLSTG